MTVKSYVFDVDGTLTPSRGKMNIDFHLWFSDFCDKHNVYLVTGSDRPRTVEQMTEYIYNKCRAVYQCSANEMWIGEKLVRQSRMEISKELEKILLEYWVKASSFPHRTGYHLDIRSGQANFSVLGRKATKQQREEYIKWDKENDERNTIAWTLNDAFGHTYEFTVAGETGIDITYKKCGKEQILLDFDGCDVVFFGDTIRPGGNDYSLAQMLMHHTDDSRAYNVSGWRETWELLAKMT